MPKKAKNMGRPKMPAKDRRVKYSFRLHPKTWKEIQKYHRRIGPGIWTLTDTVEYLLNLGLAQTITVEDQTTREKFYTDIKPVTPSPRM